MNYTEPLNKTSKPTPYPNSSLTGQQGCETVRELRVPAAQSSLDHNVEELIKTVIELETRLHPVLRNEPSPVDKCAKECVPSPPPQTVYDKIKNSSLGVGHAISRLQEIIRTLEI